MGVSNVLAIHLRPVLPTDLPRLFEIECDAEANRLAGTKPRDFATFNARWAEVSAEPSVVARAVIDGGAMVGCICAFKQEDLNSIGYWITREHWGKGYATRAIALLLAEVSTRPLYARVAAHNAASLRALHRNGFVITDRCNSPANERYVACERLTLVLS